jgi:hypothetical protein
MQWFDTLVPTAIAQGVLDFVDFHAYEFAGTHDASNATIVYNLEQIALKVNDTVQTAISETNFPIATEFSKNWTMRWNLRGQPLTEQTMGLLRNPDKILTRQVFDWGSEGKHGAYRFLPDAEGDAWTPEMEMYRAFANFSGALRLPVSKEAAQDGIESEAVCIAGAAGHCVHVKLVMVNTGIWDVATKVKLTGMPDRCSAATGHVVLLGPNVAGPVRGTKWSCTAENGINVRANGMTMLECDCSSIAMPTSAPTAAPTAVPTSAPTAAPTAVPTSAPTSAPSSSPTSSPTSAPTAAPTRGTRYISHTISFEGLSAGGYNGSVKEVYETAYGIGIGLYNTSSERYMPGTSVTSSVSTGTAATPDTRRSVNSTSIDFVASILMDGAGVTLAAEATTAAYNMSGSDFYSHLAAANAALHTRVTNPTAVTPSAPTHHTNAIPNKATSEDDDNFAGSTGFVILLACVGGVLLLAVTGFVSVGFFREAAPTKITVHEAYDASYDTEGAVMVDMVPGDKVVAI